MSGNPSSSPQTPRKPLAIGYIGKGMSTSADLEHPLDFSFYNMTALQDFIHWEPRRSYVPTGKPEEAHDNDARLLTSGKHQKKKSKPAGTLSRSKCFKVNNNCLSDISNLKLVAAELFEDPECIAWIDLSFNELVKVDDVLLTFPNLQILYLHGNQIGDLKEIEKLARLTELKKLSLHGNPLENEKGYKYQVMALLPNLQALDFSRITNADRRTASTLQSMNKNVRKGKKKQEAAED